MKKKAPHDEAASRDARSSLFLWSLILSSVLVYLTGLRTMDYGGSSFHYYVRILLSWLDLGHENNLGALWSGTVLLFLSLLAYDGYAFYRTRLPRVAHAWACVGCILVFLSLDEVGSIHERLGLLGRVDLEIGRWTLILPLAMVLGVLFGRALLILWRAGGHHRRMAIMLALGFGWLGSVAVHEHLQHALTWDTTWARAIRDMLEEGSELGGMLVLLWALMDHTTPFSRHAGPDNRPTFAALTEKWRTVTVIALIAAPIAAWFTSVFELADQGRPADWIAASLFVLTSLFAVRRFLVCGERIKWSGWITVALCLAAAAAVVLLPVTSQRFALEVSTRLVVLGLLCTLLALTRLVAMARTQGIAAAPYGILVLVALVAPWLASAPWAVYLSSQFLALCAFSLTARELQDESSGLRLSRLRTTSGLARLTPKLVHSHGGARESG
jgi:hypothetical protein